MTTDFWTGLYRGINPFVDAGGNIGLNLNTINPADQMRLDEEEKLTGLISEREAGLKSYSNQLADLINQAYTHAEGNIRGAYGGARRGILAEQDARMAKTGLLDSPISQALRDVSQDKARHAFTSNLTALEGKKMEALAAAKQQEAQNWLSLQNMEMAEKAQKEAADASAWGAILNAAATIGGALIGTMVAPGAGTMAGAAIGGGLASGLAGQNYGGVPTTSVITGQPMLAGGANLGLGNFYEQLNPYYDIDI